jgi:hypothetical protein
MNNASFADRHTKSGVPGNATWRRQPLNWQSVSKKATKASSELRFAREVIAHILRERARTSFSGPADVLLEPMRFLLESVRTNKIDSLATDLRRLESTYPTRRA